MRAGARQAAPEHRQPADVRSTPNPTRGPLSTITFDRLLARTAGYDVRLARDAAGTVLAAKCTRTDSGPGRAEALRREHRYLCRARSPHVVAAAGLLETEHGPVLLTEYLGGGDLVSLRGFAARHWLGAARDVAAALRGLHAQGLAHRDVKARNVRFAADGRACLIDFGSAAPLGAPATAAGTTAAHAAPGAAARSVRAADDVHAFAVLVYELMAGRLPFGAEPGPAAAGSPAPLAPADGLEALAGLVTRVLSAEGDTIASESVQIGTFEHMIDSILQHGTVTR